MTAAAHTELEEAMQVSRGLYPQQSLLERRSENARRRVAASLDQAGARAVTVGVCQMANQCGGAAGKQANLERMVTHLGLAANEGVQVLAFPEMCLPGYFVERDGSPDQAAAAMRSLADVAGTGPFIGVLQRTAAQRAMVLSFGFCERDGERLYNAVGVIDRDGSWLGVRRKNPLSPGPYDQVPFAEPPPHERTAVFATGYGTVGISNCFDGEFPESVRRMRLLGAELLLWSNAGTGDATLGSSCRFSACGSHAQTNRMWVASCNAVAGSFYGNSCIYAPWGEPLVQLPHDREALGVAVANLAFCDDWPTWRERLEPGLYE